MSKFFINRPIVAMVISIIMVIIGLVSMLRLPIAQFPKIAPPEIYISTTYPGADALTIEQSVATPIEQQMSGVDNMTYMYSLNMNSGNMKLYVDFDVATDPNQDQILAQMRVTQANSQLPQAVINQGVTVIKSVTSPLVLFALTSPNNTYGQTFLANYAYININDQLLRVPGIGQVQVFGAGQYAMRLWVKPDQLAKLDITVPEIVNAIQQQNTVNPSGQIGADPIPPGQEFTYAVRSQGRLETEEDFAKIVIRAETDGSFVRVGDVARIELGAQNYTQKARLDGGNAALVAIYQLPGSNAVAAAQNARKLMDDLAKRFPPDMQYVVALDTTLAVTEGIVEIEHTLWEAIILVILVVFIFLQGWRATLIPLMAVPVSLIGTFAVFPLLGFSINTLSLFGLVLAIGLVVDDAIVVVEAVEHHIEQGKTPKEAALKAMSEVSGPVVAIAVILSAVFLPTVFIPGITGRLYQQFAVTIAISVIISAFNALTLSPALAAMLLRPKKEGRGPLALFFRGFNRAFGATTNGYVSVCHLLIRRWILAILLLGLMTFSAGWFGKQLAPSFLPDEDQGYLFAAIQLPDAASLQRTDAVLSKAEEEVLKVPGVAHVTTVAGFSLFSNVNNTYSGFFFITLKPWSERKDEAQSYDAIKRNLTRILSSFPAAIGFAFPPPAIPGVGTSGGVTFILEDRAGGTVDFLAENTEKFMAEARKRPELASVISTALLKVPQIYADVDRDKVLKQGVDLSEVFQTMQAFMGGAFINYFNRFGRQWQVYVQAEGDYRTNIENLGQFYVRNSVGQPVPLNAVTSTRPSVGPEFTMRYNLYRCSQINASAAPGYSSAQAMKALEEVFAETMPPEMGFDYMGMSYQEQQAQKGVGAGVIFALSLLFVFLILAGLYESWSLPFSVLLSTPIAVAGAFAGLYIREMENNIYAQIGLVMLIGLAAKNAILIVEFAKLNYEEGKPLVEATLDGAKLRLRPILMTSFAFVLGCVPLAIASGAGAISRQVMGTAVIGGMLFSTLIAIFIIPAGFYMVERIRGDKPKEPLPPVESAGSSTGAKAHE
ncbi:MAG: multidrug efflux RND transporter permease subunit [Phycisphaeraceae bacterium]|nr:multidrug efflux RND transporter permease subunit [Phycisphaeraceae bacterium]